MKKKLNKILGWYSFVLIAFFMLVYIIGIARGAHTTHVTPTADGIGIILLSPVAYFIFKNLQSYK